MTETRNDGEETADGEISAGAVILWMSLWLFTVALAHLGFWRGALAILLWPYYLGDAIATLAGAAS